MKTKLIAAVLAVTALSSCSVYRSGQTPDDVYYSPAPTRSNAGAYVETNNDRDDGRRYNNERSYNGYDDYATSDDRWLMMRVRNRSRWSIFDDYNYYSPYNSWSYGGWGGYGGYGYGYQPGISIGIGYYDPYGYGFNNRFNDYYNWNSYYNPYYPKVIVVNPKTDPGAYNRIRNFNLNTYSNRNYNNNRAVANPHVNRGNQGYNNGNTTTNNSSLGNTFRRVFSNSNSTSNQQRNRDTYRNNDNYRTQERPNVYTPSNDNSTYRPSNSGSSNSGSSSSGSGSSSGSRPNRR